MNIFNGLISALSVGNKWSLPAGWNLNSRKRLQKAASSLDWEYE